MNKMPVNNRFGILLAQKRMEEKRNISLTEVQTVTKITRPTLQAWQSNTVTRYDVKVIDALCRYFGVGIADLLEYVEDGNYIPVSHERK